VQDANRPRKLLGLDIWRAAVGLGSGMVRLARFGTVRHSNIALCGDAADDAALLAFSAPAGTIRLNEAARDALLGEGIDCRECAVFSENTAPPAWEMT
jgi:hypothetical protein